MSRESVLVLLAVLVAVTPFAGLPLSWLMIVLPVLGVLIGGIGYSLRARRRQIHEQRPSSEESA